MPDTLGTLSTEAKSFYDRKLLMRALPIIQLAAAGQMRDIPKNGGNQVSYRRYNALSTATTALTEGVTPAAASLSLTEVTGTVALYGNYVEVSDALDMMGIDKTILESTELLGENAARSVDQIIRAEVQAGTSVQYATGSARSSQASTNILTLNMVKRAVRTLRANDARPFYGSRSEATGEDGLFIGFMHPNVLHDVTNDTAILNTFQYSDPNKLFNFKLGTFGGVAWIVTTHAPVFTAAGSGGADVYGTLIFGQEAFGVVNVAGTGKFKTVVKPLGSAGTSDPLDQRATIGWKSFQLPKILNNNFMIRVETGASG